jgi:hypothetical protein
VLPASYGDVLPRMFQDMLQRLQLFPSIHGKAMLALSSGPNARQSSWQRVFCCQSGCCVVKSWVVSPTYGGVISRQLAAEYFCTHTFSVTGCEIQQAGHQGWAALFALIGHWGESAPPTALTISPSRIEPLRFMARLSPSVVLA